MVWHVQLVSYILSLFTVLGELGAIFLLLALLSRRFNWRFAFFDRPLALLAPHGVTFAFIVAASGVVSSLYYSEIAGFVPCTLCWWQRIFFYPQAIILGMALLGKARDAARACYALSAGGILFAAYHTYLQFGGSPLVPCAAGGASCAQRYFLEFGYVTIPTMAFTAFALIILMLLMKKGE